ncbi:MAG: DinB family protein [Gemmatimonadetes bacterium]|nr:DinB family protein [Gemmatimonadota bacterium]
MKSRRQLAALEPMVLGPLHGLEPEDWHRGPAAKWTIAQVVAHLALGVDLSSSVFAQRAEKTGMIRRSNPGQAVLRHLLLGFGKFPPGRQAPETTRPPEKPDPEIVAAQYRMGVERFATMAETWPEKRQMEIFVKHPLLGDLNLPEWIRFHYVHARHHVKQIQSRLRYIARGGRESGSEKSIESR